MNIVFYILVIAALVIVWTWLACIFKPIGKYLYRLFKDVKDVMTECDKEEKEN